MNLVASSTQFKVLSADERFRNCRTSAARWCKVRALELRQGLLGHRDPTHTSRYTRVAARRFEGKWDQVRAIRKQSSSRRLPRAVWKKGCGRGCDCDGATKPGRLRN